MKDVLIKSLLKKQEVIVEQDDRITAIGKKISDQDEYLMFELATNRFYFVYDDGDEVYIDHFLEKIFEELE